MSEQIFPETRQAAIDVQARAALRAESGRFLRAASWPTLPDRSPAFSRALSLIARLSSALTPETPPLTFSEAEHLRDVAKESYDSGFSDGCDWGQAANDDLRSLAQYVNLQEDAPLSDITVAVSKALIAARLPGVTAETARLVERANQRRAFMSTEQSRNWDERLIVDLADALIAALHGNE